MKILAFAGSTSRHSINLQLVDYTLRFFPDDQINRLDLNAFEMPIYSIDREKENGFPLQAIDFLKQIEESDAIICSLAEHNNSYTTAFKNILDWTSRANRYVFQGKPMFLMSTSPGGYGGGNVMKAASSFFPKCQAELVAQFSLPSFMQNFEEGEIKNEEMKTLFLEQLQLFKTHIEN